MSPAQAPQRYPKRKRGEVSYKYVDESEELGEDVEHAIPIQDDPDNEVDWKTSMKKASKTKARKKQHRKAAKRSIFPFMKLPAELRNNIYRYCLQTPGGVVKLVQQSILPDRPRKRLAQGFDIYDRLSLAQKSTRNLALLRVSKTVYQEAVGFVYNQEFNFKNLPSMWAFLSCLSTETKCLLRHIEVKLCENEWNFLPVVSRELPAQGNNLERLIIPNLGGHVGVGNPSKYLKATKRPVESLEINLPTLDMVIGITMAKAVYDFMHPFVIGFVKDKGVEELVDTMDLFRTRPHLDYKFWRVERRFNNLGSQPWSNARADRARAAMIREMRDIIEEDNI